MDTPELRSIRAEARDRSGKTVNVTLAVEAPITLALNNTELVTLLCTPEHLDELALGFLKSDGLIESREDVRELRVDQAAGRVEVSAAPRPPVAGPRMITTGLGKGTMYRAVLEGVRAGGLRVDSPLKVAASTIVGLMQRLSDSTDLHSATRGVHGVALADANGLWLLRQDVGRHNAVDKLAGRCLLDGFDTAGCLLLATGRISSEMLIKAARMGVPLLASRAVPTSLAVELAAAVGLTLVGYVRGEEMTVYCNAQRVLWDRA